MVSRFSNPIRFMSLKSTRLDPPPPVEREAKGGYLMRRGEVYLHGGTSGKRLSADGPKTFGGDQLLRLALPQV
jgi:hypothetical protein